ncbi:MAG: NHL repeat-containing protein, partial [Elusimicrobia bacterium]|nr:NHL repeat-containing protein [Elusimicrobiota bacterium]
MKKNILAILLLQLTFLNFNAAAYDKLDFQSQVTNSAITNPIDISICGTNTAIIDSKTKSLLIFNDKGNLVKKTNTNFKSPSAVACSMSKIYVADSKNSEINVFDFTGKSLWSFGSKGSMPGQLSSPTGIAIGFDKRVYVSNTGNKRVDIYNLDGIFMYGFPTVIPGGANKISPFKINVDRASNIYVSDNKGKMVIKYNAFGKVLKEFNIDNSGIAVDDYGFIYIVDSKKGKIKELSPSGEVLGTFGTRGKGKSEFSDLTDVEVNGEGKVYLSDAGNKKIVTIVLVNKLRKEKLKTTSSASMFNL